MTIISTQYASGIVAATEKAAIASSKLIGLGDEKAADQVAVDAMRTALNAIDFDGRIVIGEGERDEAPMLYIGEEVGTGKNHEVDIALDPLEGTTITAKGMPNSLSVVAAAQKGGLLYAPDTYMNKIAVGSSLPADLRAPDPRAAWHGPQGDDGRPDRHQCRRGRHEARAQGYGSHQHHRLHQRFPRHDRGRAGSHRQQGQAGRRRHAAAGRDAHAV